MTQIHLTLCAETELLWDAAEDLQRIHAALAKRHGDAFRRLDWDIENAFGAIAPGDIGSERLDGSTFVFTPPAAWLELIERGRALGVI